MQADSNDPADCTYVWENIQSSEGQLLGEQRNYARRLRDSGCVRVDSC